MSKAEGEAWIARFYQEHQAFPWQVGPFDPMNNLIDHLIALGQSEYAAQSGQWTKVQTEGNVYADRTPVPEFWNVAYYTRYQGPTTMPSGSPGPWQYSLGQGQLPPPAAPLFYALGLGETGQPYAVPRPWTPAPPATTEERPGPPVIWRLPPPG
jgi:hypothetical protein